MKKYLAIILISAVVGDSIKVAELVKIPNLLLHYAEHKSSHPGDTAITFLFKHYIKNQQPESDKDKSSDSRLPFKGAQNLQTHLTFFDFTDNTFQFVLSTVEKPFVLFQEAIVPSCAFDIWQPPKVA